MLFETLHDTNGEDETRVRRAFGWVVTFRDFPVGSWQNVGGDEMMTHALTFFTKGRAEFYLDGVRRGDRIPGILSSEYEPVGQDGMFELKYVEPTTRVCIPRYVNNDQLPNVKKIHLTEPITVKAGFKALVCLGSVTVGEKVFEEEKTISVSSPEVTLVPNGDCYLLDFTDSSSRSKKAV